MSIFILRCSVGSSVIIWDWPYDINTFLTIYSHPYAWTEQISTSHSLQEIWMTTFHYPFFFIGYIFHLSMFHIFVLEEIFIFSLAGLSMYYLTSYLLKKFYTNKYQKLLAVSSILAGLFYMFNPSFMIGDVQRYGTILGYAIFPLIILFFIKGMEEDKKYCSILSGLLGFYAFIFDFRYFAASIIFFLGYSAYYFLLLKKSFWEKRKTFLLPFIILFLLFLPTILSWWTGMGVVTGVPLSKNAVEIPWGNANPINMLRGMSFFLIPQSYANPPSIIVENYLAITLLSFVIPIMAYLSILIIPRNRYVLFFAFIPTFFLLLFSSRDFLYWLTLDAPFHDFVGRLFRTTRIVDLFVSASCGVLISFTAIEIMKAIKTKIKFSFKKYLQFIFIIFLMFSIIVPSWPLATGDINGKFEPTTVPIEYENVNSWLSEQKGDFKVLWIPEFSGSYQPIWNKGKYADNILTFSSAKPTYLVQNRIQKHFIDYIITLYYNSLLCRGDLTNTAKFLADIDVKYIILHNDTTHLSAKVDLIVSELKNNPDFRLVEQKNFIYIFENERCTNEQIFLPDDFILVSGGLEVNRNFREVLNKSNLDDFTYATIYLDQGWNQNDALTSSSVLLFSNYKSILDFMVRFIDEGYVVTPFFDTIEYQPQEKWSKGLLTDSHHAVWHDFINQFQNQKWEFNYELGWGFVFTEGNDTLKMPIKVNDDAQYCLYGRILKSTRGGEIKISIDDELSTVIDTTDPKKAEFVWEKIGEINLSKGEHEIRLENLGGSNAVNIFVLVPIEKMEMYEKQVDEILADKTILYLIDIDSDLYKIHDEEGIASSSVEIIKNGAHSIAIKMPSEENKDLNINIGNDFFTINLTESDDSWFYIHDIYLEKGKYEIKLSPVQPNLFKNPSFENWNDSVDSPDYWSESIIKLLPDRSIFMGNPSFEDWSYLTKTPSYWSEPGSSFTGTLDPSTKWDGRYSYNLTTNITSKDWSWIRSEEIPVESGETYMFKTHMSWENVAQSHITIEAFDSSLDRWYQMVQVPSGKDGTSDWVEFNVEKDVPENVAKIRIVLNAGWVLDSSKGNATTWFDDIEISQLKSKKIFSGTLNTSTKWEGDYSYKLTTNNTFKDWSWIRSEEIPVESGETYMFKTHMSWENVAQSHITIEAFDSSLDRWYQMVQVPSGKDGTSDWVEFNVEKDVPENVAKIRIVLNAGWVLDSSKGNATTWFDDVKVYKKSPELEKIILYSSQGTETLNDIFSPKENPAKIITYEKVDPTKYIITINATSPFMLSFAESYDPLWVAYVDGTEYQPVPLYSVINGFWINKTGDLEIVLRYKPQDWFEVGSIISITTLVGCMGYLLYDWKKDDKRIKMIKKKLQELLKRKK